MRIRSPAFPQGGQIPVRHTCDGDNLSPPLEWDEVPEGTRSFVVFCNDPDAPGRIFHHWIAYDIPPDCHHLGEGKGQATLSDGIHQGQNDFGKPGYGGPCPPHGHGTHHYHFRVCALATDHLGAAPGASYDEVLELAKPHILDEAELVGLYERHR